MPAAPTKIGTPGAAALAAAAGLWLVYAGLRDVPVFEGLRQLLRAEKPTSPVTREPFSPGKRAGEIIAGLKVGQAVGPAIAASGDSGIDRLISCAASGYQALRPVAGSLRIAGWRSTGSVPNSDHPKGLALDIMNPDGLQANQIIGAFRPLPGAHYWIWNRQIASAETAWIPRAYGGPNPHTDHVHLSFYDRCR